MRSRRAMREFLSGNVELCRGYVPARRPRSGGGVQLIVADMRMADG